MEPIQFVNTGADFWRYQLYVYFHLRVMRLLISLLFLFASLSILALLQGSLLPLLLIPALAVILAGRMRLNTRRANQVFMKRGVQSITIGPQGISQTSMLGTSLLSWQGIQAIQEDQQQIYLLLEVAGAKTLIMAILIPKRAFADAQHASQFLALAQEYWQHRNSQFAQSNCEEENTL